MENGLEDNNDEEGRKLRRALLERFSESRLSCLNMQNEEEGKTEINLLPYSWLHKLSGQWQDREWDRSKWIWDIGRNVHMQGVIQTS